MIMCLSAAARALGVTRKKLEYGVYAGKLPVIRYDGKPYVHVDQVREILQEEKERGVTMREAAQRLNVRYEVILNEVHAGRLKVTKVKGHYYAPISAVKDALARRETLRRARG